jgi:hypothetical protein
MRRLNRGKRLSIHGEKPINAPAFAFVQRLRCSQLRDVGNGRS